MPPCTWMPVDATSMPQSVQQPLTMGMSRSPRACEAARTASSGCESPRSSWYAAYNASAREASTVDFISSSMRLTSGWPMMGAGEELVPSDADPATLATGTGGLPCTRVRAQPAACWNARSACAYPSSPTDNRAAFIITNMYSSPRFGSPISCPSAPSFSPYIITQVGLAWMPSLCSMEAQYRSLRAPGEPSAFTQNLGTMNSEMPRVPGGAPSMRASTMWMMFSVRSCSP